MVSVLSKDSNLEDITFAKACRTGKIGKTSAIYPTISAKSRLSNHKITNEGECKDIKVLYPLIAIL